MKKLKTILFGLSLLLATVFSLTTTQEASADVEGGKKYDLGYCTNGVDVWSACNFPNGLCTRPIWCSENAPQK